MDSERIEALEKLVAKLIFILNDKTEPEKCYVNAWHVHDDWCEIYEQAAKLLTPPAKGSANDQREIEI